MAIWKTVINKITYEPLATSQFELIEDSTEKEKYEEKEDEVSQESHEVITKKNSHLSKSNKSPLPIEEWNKQKNEDTTKAIPKENGNVTRNVKLNLQRIKIDFGVPDNSDIIIREFRICNKLNAFIIYIEGMISRSLINDSVLRPLMRRNNFEDFFHDNNSQNIEDYICDNVIYVHDIEKIKEFNKISYEILTGKTGLFIEGSQYCLIVNCKGFDKRSIDKPTTENVILGSQEGFTESIRTNITQVRRIIKNKNLTVEMVKVGQLNQSYIGVVYLKGIVNGEVLKELKKRLSNIDMDYILGSTMVSQFIENKLTCKFFPQLLTTERPDRVAAFLMDGKIAILSDGTPFADVLPVTFYEFLHTTEDTYLRPQYGTFLRLVRVFGLFVAMFLPGLYIALTLFHQEMIPTELLTSIARSKESVPFPTLAEVIILEISFELIREGGIRVPGLIGQTLGIIGALILGQAAVAAGLVSPILIIIVAFTGLGSFAVPNYSMGIGVRILRFFFIFLGASFGFYGISLGIFLFSCIMANIKSFGVPYFSPVAPKSKKYSEVILRKSLGAQKKRPDFMNTPNKRKQGKKS